MAKRCMIEREKKRAKLILKYADKRRELQEVMRSVNTTIDEKLAASNALQKLPRNSSAVRARSRCLITGRSRGVYPEFGLSRHKLREWAAGFLPGLRKASW